VIVFGVLPKLGVAGGIGFLLGLIVVSVVQPTTDGGVAILIAIPVVFCTIIGGIVTASSKLRSRQPTIPED
jgi:hypothetical protein